MKNQKYSRQFVSDLGEVMAASRASQFAKVAELTAKMLRDKPECKSPYIFGVEALQKLGRLEDARTLAEIGLAHHPKCELLSVMLFHLLMEMGKRREARDEMRRFLESAKSPEYERIIIEAHLQATASNWKRSNAAPSPPLVGDDHLEN